MHLTGLFDIDKVFDNAMNLDYDNLMPEEFTIVKWMIESFSYKYNIRILSNISLGLFKQLLEENPNLIFKHTDLFYKVSSVNGNNCKDKYKKLFKTMCEFIDEKYDKNEAGSMLANIFLNKSRYWMIPIISGHVDMIYLYDKYLFEHVAMAHSSLETRRMIIAELMNKFMGSGFEFSFDKVSLDNLDLALFNDFKKKNNITGLN